jgi:AraC family transcriptional regulator
MLSLSTVESATLPSTKAIPDPDSEITLKHAQVLSHRSDHFGDIRAELFLCESMQRNELEMCAHMHTLLMRCEGVASRCEISWHDDSRRKTMPELRRGSILFNPAHSHVRVCKKDQGRYGYIALYIPLLALEALSDDRRDASNNMTLVPQGGPGQPELCQVMFAMRDEIETPGAAGRLFKETLAVQLLIQLVRRGGEFAIAPAEGGLAAWQLRRTIDLLESDLAQTPSLAQLAAHVGLNPTHFCTAFRQSTGLPPHRYLLNRRVAHAKSLMVNPRLSLTEIALRSGFGSSSRFTTGFRRIDGRTPSAYRRGL